MKPALIIKGDKISNISVFVFDGKIHKELSRNEFSRLLADYVESLFGCDLPERFTGKTFYNEFIDAVMKENLLSNEKAKSTTPDGKAWKNGYLRFNQMGSRYKVKLHKLTKDILSGKPHAVDYTSPTFKKVGANLEIELENKAKFVIKSLFRRNLQFKCMGRAFLKSILLAKHEGHLYQSLFYISGPLHLRTPFGS